jgi:hypothetical protein
MAGAAFGSFSGFENLSRTRPGANAFPKSVK